MSKDFLSFDIDYYTQFSNGGEKIVNMIDRLVDLDVPIRTFVYHHEMLSFVNKFPSDRLITIDYHSDLADFDISLARKDTKYRKKAGVVFNEGTWCNYVKWREDAEFVWVYPDKECMYEVRDGYRHRGSGRCDTGTSPFLYDVSGWKKTRSQLIGIPRDLSNVQAVGICISPDWIDVDKISMAIKRMQDHKIISRRVINRLKQVIDKDIRPELVLN